MLSQLNFVEHNVSLREKTYYKMGGVAKFFATPTLLSELVQTIHLAKENRLCIAVLGAGSNCVFSDETFEGVVISLQKFSQWWWESEEILFAESGVTNTQIANICFDRERAGASWMYRMPGQIGASVRMNARCYGGEISQIVTDVLTIDSDGHLQTYCAKDIFKGYKNTHLMNAPEIVVGMRFAFPQKESKAKLLEHMKSCEDNRQSKHHFLYPSVGSTFKNNYAYGKPSGQIFDELGLKGTKRGECEISMHHGNFIWNKNCAQTKDMLELSALMRKEAKNKLNVELNLEVQPIGAFTSEQFESCGMQNSGPYIKQDDKYLTGLFYSPHVKKEHHFPKCIFSSFFTQYFHQSQKNVWDINVKVFQLQAFEDANKNEDAPFLRWITQCEHNYKNIFSLIPKGHHPDRLWEYSVSEFFLSHPENTHYLECEMAPTEEHLILEFDDIRHRKQTESLAPLNCLIFSQAEDCKFEFGLELSFAQIKHLISNKTIKMQGALSLGNKNYWLAPYWNVKTRKADFHQPSLFLNVHIL